MSPSSQPLTFLDRLNVSTLLEANMVSANSRGRLTSGEARILKARVTQYLTTVDKKDSYVCDSLEFPHLSVHDSKDIIEAKRCYRAIFQAHFRKIEATFGPDVMFRQEWKLVEKLQEWLDGCGEIEEKHLRNSKTIMQVLEPHYQSLEIHLIQHYEKVLKIFVTGIMVDEGEGPYVEMLKAHYNRKLGRSLDPILEEIRQFFMSNHAERSLMIAFFGAITPLPATNPPPKWRDTSNDSDDIKGMKSLWMPRIDALEQKIKLFMGQNYTALPTSFDHIMESIGISWEISMAQLPNSRLHREPADYAAARAMVQGRAMTVILALRLALEGIETGLEDVPWTDFPIPDFFDHEKNTDWIEAKWELDMWEDHDRKTCDICQKLPTLFQKKVRSCTWAQVRWLESQA